MQRNILNLSSQDLDAKKHKQEMDRLRDAARHEVMTDEQRESMNKKQREARHLKKYGTLPDESGIQDNDNMDPHESENYQREIDVSPEFITPINTGMNRHRCSKVNNIYVCYDWKNED